MDMVEIGTEFVYRQMKYAVLSVDDHEVGLSGATTNLAGEVVIPSKVMFNGSEYTVVAVCTLAFADTGRVRSIRYPGTVRYLMSHAFAGAELDINFELPEDLEYVGGYHFAGSTGLREVSIPKSIVDVPVGMFNDCLGLVSVRIHSDVETIGDFAFMGCEDLSRVEIDEPSDIDDPEGAVLPNSVCEVGGSAFTNTRILRVYTDAEIGHRYEDVPEFRRRDENSGLKRVRSGYTGGR